LGAAENISGCESECTAAPARPVTPGICTGGYDGSIVSVLTALVSPAIRDGCAFAVNEAL
jgi:hypothetical protein